MIYFLDSSPELSGNYLARKHIRCMLNSACSVIATVLYNRGLEIPYKPYNKNKELIKWASKTQSNFNWILDYGINLKKRYRETFGRDVNLKINFEDYIDKNISCNKEIENFPLLLPDKFKSKNIVDSYRNYYVNKINKSDYTGQKIPSWFSEKYLEKEEVIYFEYFEELKTSLKVVKKGEDTIIKKLIDGVWTDFNILMLEERLIIERILKND